MDTFRVGTVLELVRELAYSMADVGLNTRILIQPSMGKGVFKSLPLALSGVMSIMQGMDWEDGLVGSHVNFGQVNSHMIRRAGCHVNAGRINHKRYAILVIASRHFWPGKHKPSAMLAITSTLTRPITSDSAHTSSK